MKEVCQFVIITLLAKWIIDIKENKYSNNGGLKIKLLHIIGKP